MKKTLRLILIVVAVLAVAAVAMKMIKDRKIAAAATALAAENKTQAVIELAASDVFTVRPIELEQGLPISGTLKAANSAFVKAKVAGELQGLTVREGEFVKAGQIIARVDAAEYQARVTQAQRSADAAKAQIDIAQRSFDNNKALVNQGFISATALETSAASLEAAKATHASTLAGVEVARKALDDTVLKAPITGWVSQRLTQPGERVGIDARVIEIIDTQKLELEAQISAGESVDVRIGQIASLSVEGRATPIDATVVRINPSAIAGSRGVLVYLALGNASGLRQGLFAQGKLGTQRVQALAIPVSAVRTDKPTPYVQTIQNGRIVPVSVALGVRGESSQFPGEVLFAIKDIASGAMITRANVGVLRENTMVKIAENKPLAAPASPAVSSAGTGK